MKIVSSVAELNSLQNLSEGDLILVDDEQHGNKQVYHYTNGELFPISSNANLNLSLYDLNKNVISQLEPLDLNEIGEKMSLFSDFYNKTNNKHYMLLCKEYNYYTIFEYEHMLPFPDFAGSVSNIISELGDVYSIENDSTGGAVEIWIKPKEEKTPLVFYLFPYDQGVVYYG